MLKKSIAMMLAVVMGASLAACGGGSQLLPIALYFIQTT